MEKGVTLLVGRNPVRTELVRRLRSRNNTETVAKTVLLKELANVVAARTLAVLDVSSDSNVLLAVVLLDAHLTAKVVTKLPNLHLLLKVLNKVLKVEELV